MPAAALEATRPSAWRWRLLDFLTSQETFVSSIKGNRLRSRTSAFARSLMMKRPRQMLYVLSKEHGWDRRGAWLRTAFWMVPVVAAALGRYLLREAVRLTPRFGEVP